LKRRALELCKSLIIVLLIGSVVLLTLSVNRGAVTAGSFSETAQSAATAASVDAAQPLAISARSSVGRTSYFGDFSSLDGAFERFGGYLAAALDSVSDSSVVSEADFLAALSRPGVCFVYPCEVSSALLASWLDASAPAQAFIAQRLLLSVSDGKISLMTAGDSFRSFPTGLDASSLNALLEGLQPDGSFFAFESGERTYAAVSPYSLVCETAPAPSAASASTPYSDAMRNAAAIALGFNPYGSSYRDASGATVYAESDGTFRMGSDGRIELHSSSGRFAAPSSSDAGLSDYARSLAARLSGGSAGDARLYLSSLTRSGSTVTAMFDYVLSGLIVARPDGPAVKAVFSGGILTEFTMALRSYTLVRDTPIPCLPARQAAAISARGALLELQYADLGTDELNAGWRSN